MRHQIAVGDDWIRGIVERAMQDLGWGVRELSRQTNLAVDAPTISNYVRGRHTIRSASLCKILDALGLTVSPVKGKRSARVAQAGDGTDCP